ncbi:hypothetical protein H2200_002288 [Cladophialophora chaetospira]|uniref:Uncharacterized protein n=1 Tax=Cladophialophora chaetospira TaxID=386627 RepID=A0AA39CMY2_9EURO|nr:hypothetical protein H2200_002288 [Cladophialophora chaetospira]
MSGRMVGWALAIGLGVLNGYMIFKPAFEARELEKVKDLHDRERAAAQLEPSMTEITVQPNYKRNLLEENAQKSETP